MKRILYCPLLLVMLLMVTISRPVSAQQVIPNYGMFSQASYPNYDTGGSVKGTYTVQVSKSAHTFEPGDFIIQVAIPVNAARFTGANYVLPSGFAVRSGTGRDGDAYLTIELTAPWSGFGPGPTGNVKQFVFETKFIGPAIEQPTLVSVGLEQPASNNMIITPGSPVGSNLNVANVPLPVIFSEVNAKETNCKAEITWTTASEKNNRSFVIERSATGDKFSKIGTVAATNNAFGDSYSFIDNSPLKGSSFYRIVQVDNDGKSTTSKVLSLSTNCAAAAIELYPNPTSGIVNVKGLQGTNVIKILNIAGQEVMKAKSETEIHSMKVDGLAPGTYHVQVAKDSEIVFNGKFVKVD